MEELTGEEFDQFLSSFKNNQRYYNTLEIISYSNENKPLTPNIDFKMYCLDHIKDDTKSFAGMLPKSMDAIFYKKEDNILYLIEFKGSNLNDHGLNKVQNVFDKVVSKNNSITIKSHNKGSNKKDYDCYDKDMEDDLKYVKDHFKDTIQEDSEKKPIESLFMTIPLIYLSRLGVPSTTPSTLRAYSFLISPLSLLSLFSSLEALKSLKTLLKLVASLKTTL